MLPTYIFSSKLLKFKPAVYMYRQYNKGEGLEPRLSKYVTIKSKSRLIKHQLFTFDVDIESWLKSIGFDVVNYG